MNRRRRGAPTRGEAAAGPAESVAKAELSRLCPVLARSREYGGGAGRRPPVAAFSRAWQPPAPVSLPPGYIAPHRTAPPGLRSYSSRSSLLAAVPGGFRERGAGHCVSVSCRNTLGWAAGTAGAGLAAQAVRLGARRAARACAGIYSPPGHGGGRLRLVTGSEECGHTTAEPSWPGVVGRMFCDIWHLTRSGLMGYGTAAIGGAAALPCV